jgi:hypothetical protein
MWRKLVHLLVRVKKGLKQLTRVYGTLLNSGPRNLSTNSNIHCSISTTNSANSSTFPRSNMGKKWRKYNGSASDSTNEHFPCLFSNSTQCFYLRTSLGLPFIMQCSSYRATLSLNKIVYIARVIHPRCKFYLCIK